jgi:hypothetical protein
LKDICKAYYDRMYLCEGQKWDLEHEVRKRDWEVLPNKMQNTKKILSKNIYKILDLSLRHEQHKTRFLSPFFNFNYLIWFWIHFNTKKTKMLIVTKFHPKKTKKSTIRSNFKNCIKILHFSSPDHHMFIPHHIFFKNAPRTSCWQSYEKINKM